MASIEIFKNESFGEVRVAGTSEEPLFCASDLCRALGYANGRDAISKHVDEGDVAKCDTPTASGIQPMTYVNESGLYALIFSSKQPNAKAFKKWVTSEVLPSIRKTGSYNLAKVGLPDFTNPAEAARAWAEQYELKMLAQAEAEENKRQVAILTHTNKTYTATEIAKEAGLQSASQLNRILKEKGIQYKINGTWVPYQKYATLGWFDIKQEVADNGHIIYHRRITGDGRKGILNILLGRAAV